MRQRIKGVATTALIAGSVFGAASVANAAALPTFHQVVKTRAAGERFDIVERPVSGAMSSYLFGGRSYRNYNQWSFQLVRLTDHKVIATDKGDGYLLNYMSWELTDHTTGYGTDSVSSQWWLQRMFSTGARMSEAQLRTFAATKNIAG